MPGAVETGGGGGGGWAAIVRKDVAPVTVEGPLLRSTEGLKTVVVDANALIGGGTNLHRIADQFCTVREVLDEVRDPQSRHHLATLPVTLACLEPSSEALAAVVKFSRATGDFQALSNVDLKLLALAYTLEAEVHGTAHIRCSPPPLLVRISSRQPERELPGWGTVKNPEEWDAIDETEPSGAVKEPSRILGLQSLDSERSVSDVSRVYSAESELRQTVDDGAEDLSDVSRNYSAESELRQTVNDRAEDLHEGLGFTSGPAEEEKSHTRGLESLDTEVSRSEMSGDSVEGGLEATVDDRAENLREGDESGAAEEDWQRASCRSTRRNYLKREAKRSARRQAAESVGAEIPYGVGEEGESNPGEEGGSEESGMTAPLESNSSIACMTADFAMQNVLLQMGLRLLSANGMHIRELNKWVLKCQACHHVVLAVGRIFCPKCGNGGTLAKVSVTVGQNGTVHSGRTQRVNLRGTRYSLPLPKGGREGAIQNPILREDQLPKMKKAVHFDRVNLADVGFTDIRDKKDPKLAGVKAAAAVFGGRRNPNDRRTARIR